MATKSREKSQKRKSVAQEAENTGGIMAVLPWLGRAGNRNPPLHFMLRDGGIDEDGAFMMKTGKHKDDEESSSLFVTSFDVQVAINFSEKRRKKGVAIAEPLRQG